MARPLRRKIKNWFVTNTDEYTKESLALTTNETETFSDEGYFEVPIMVCNFLNNKPEEFADQLTLMDWTTFKAIKREEIRNCAENKWNEVPNINILMERLVSLRTWVSDVVLATPTAELRTTVLQLFIRLVRRLHKHGNLHSAKAVVEGLHSEPVRRLRSSWKKVSSKSKKHFKKYRKIYLNAGKVGKKMQVAWSAYGARCIPAIDLLFGELESEERIQDVSDFVEYTQTSNYSHIWPECPSLQHYLGSLHYSAQQSSEPLEVIGVKLSEKLDPSK